MKFRYIYEEYGDIKGKQTITKEDLIAVKNRHHDFLIDVLEGCYYDAEENTWKEIEGSS